MIILHIMRILRSTTTVIIMAAIGLYSCSTSSRFSREKYPDRNTENSGTKTIRYRNLSALETVTGNASFYGKDFHGKFTANGEVFNMYDLTAAHRTYSFGTIIRVTNLENDQSVIVRINDRGPFVEGRIIDLSRAAAEKIGMLKNGIAKVFIEVVSGSGSTDSLYSVQIGSYSEQENAARVKDLFEKRDFTVVIEVSVKGFHRVLITGIALNSLQPLLKELAAMGFIHVLIKRK